jgi:hypothetical protein
MYVYTQPPEDAVLCWRFLAGPFGTNLSHRLRLAIYPLAGFGWASVIAATCLLFSCFG